jgi:hypothetical protein
MGGQSDFHKGIPDAVLWLDEEEIMTKYTE